MSPKCRTAREVRLAGGHLNEIVPQTLVVFQWLLVLFKVELLFLRPYALVIAKGEVSLGGRK